MGEEKLRKYLRPGSLALEIPTSLMVVPSSKVGVDEISTRLWLSYERAEA